MTKHNVIDRIKVSDLRDWTESPDGGDSMFVAVQGAGHAGWYGPISNEAAAYVDTVIARAIIGEPFEDHRALHRMLSRMVTPMAGKSGSWAVGAVDCAVWDLHGRVTGAPVAKLLSPTAERVVPLYASWLRLDVADPAVADTVMLIGRDNWQFTKWGLRHHLNEDVAVAAADIVDAVERVTVALGEAAAFDAVFTWNPALLTAFASLLDPPRLVWLEDPLTEPGESCRYANDVPLAVGEALLLHDDPSLLSHELRAFTLDVVGCGGLTRAVDLVAAARSAGIPVYPHGRSLIPAAHLTAAFPQAVTAAEYQLQWEPARQRLYAEPWLPVDGQLFLPDLPGLGIRPRSR